MNRWTGVFAMSVFGVALATLPPRAKADEPPVKTPEEHARQMAAVDPSKLPALEMDMHRLSTLLEGKRPKANLEPMIMRPEQIKDAASKLEALYKRVGRRPNILILLVDDLGWGDLGVYGGGANFGVDTPNIDAIAKGGLQLLAAYAQPTCTPTRVSMNTGRLPIRSGLVRPTAAGGGVPGIAGEITAAKILADNGYLTALHGKWHCGEDPGSWPTAVGYDEYYGFLSVIDAYTDFRQLQHSPRAAQDPDLQKKILAYPNFNWHVTSGKRGDTELQNGPVIDDKMAAELDGIFAEKSIDFIRRAAKASKPFYLMHAFSKVHFFNKVTDAWKGKSKGWDVYHDSLAEVDDIVGRLIRTLKETKQEDNTFVFFLSDNGPEQDAWPDSGFTPFRGAKGTTWEGGMRVPAIAYWPGTIKAGRASGDMFDASDLFNTALTIAGLADKIPSDRYIDGIDQTSFLLPDNGQTAREALYYWNQTHFAGLRWDNWKVKTFVEMTYDAPGAEMGGLNNVYTVKPNFGWLYNLYTDPREARVTTVMQAWVMSLGMEPYIKQHVLSLMKYPPALKPEF
jgi:arylsulfatase A-like enzyme